MAENSFTLDNPAHEWFAVGSTARVALGGGAGAPQYQAIGVAEVVTPPVPAGPADGLTRADVRGLVAALARQGVTATCSLADGPRYGAIEIDSNLPDFRVCLGGPDVSSFAAAVLAAAGPAGRAAGRPAQRGRDGAGVGPGGPQPGRCLRRPR